MTTLKQYMDKVYLQKVQEQRRQAEKQLDRMV